MNSASVPPSSSSEIIKYGDTVYDLLVPVDPIKILKLVEPNLIYTETSNLQSNLQVYTVIAKYNKTPFKGMHSDPDQAKLKTAQKVLDAYIKFSFKEKAQVIVPNLKGKLHKVLNNKKGGKYKKNYIVGQQTIYSHKKQKERLVYTFFQLNPSIRIKLIHSPRTWTATVNIGGKEYRKESQKKRIAHEEVVIAVLSSFTAADMDHLVKVTNAKLRKSKREAHHLLQPADVEMITIDDDDEESLNDGEASSKNPNEKLVEENNNNDVEAILCDSTNVVQEESTSNNDSEGFGDFVSRLVESSFQEVKKADPSIPDYKVLAGIVMSSGIAINGSKVVSLATGTRSISGTKLSSVGEAVNDCHAEVLVRRGLVCFLYDQIEKFTTKPEESILEPAGNDDHLRLKVKEDVRFHLYVSSTPCGDASLDSLSDTSSNCHGGGTLRRKRKRGDETLPLVGGEIQSWNGIMSGESLITMSCSDKMARWNVLGLQGSLLSNIIHPIYFHTVVIGDRFNSANLNRALLYRVSHLKNIPAPFIVAQPILVPGTSSMTITTNLREIHLIHKYSVCWVDGWRNPEMIESTKGKLEDGSSSNLCKRSFLQRFLSVAQRVPEWYKLVEPLVKDGKISYVDLKKASKQFGETKEKVNSSFEEAGFGKWVKKPSEQDAFEWPFGRVVVKGEK